MARSSEEVSITVSFSGVMTEATSKLIVNSSRTEGSFVWFLFPVRFHSDSFQITLNNHVKYYIVQVDIITKMISFSVLSRLFRELCLLQYPGLIQGRAFDILRASALPDPRPRPDLEEVSFDASLNLKTSAGRISASTVEPHIFCHNWRFKPRTLWSILNSGFNARALYSGGFVL